VKQKKQIKTSRTKEGNIKALQHSIDKFGDPGKLKAVQLRKLRGS